MIKKYVYIEFELTSPLSIGGGLAKETDKDVLRDSRGIPYIPASTLAGLYRSYFTKEEQRGYFGYIDKNFGVAEEKGKIDPQNIEKKEFEAKESRLIIYDAILINSDCFSVAIRNGVGLDDYKTSIDGAKFDYEIVEPGSRFWTAIEYNAEDEEDNKPIDVIMTLWKNEMVVVGGKATRGLGRMKPIFVKEKFFDLSNDSELDEWLRFDLYDKGYSGWDDWKRSFELSSDVVGIELTLKQESPLTVRVYTTEVSTENQTAPDYCQLVDKYYKLEDGKTIYKDVVTIPGTSWAGVFRHNMKKYISNDDIDSNDRGDGLVDLFGGQALVTKKDRKGEEIGSKEEQLIKSHISFSETYFENAESQDFSRNAIDRFSGGASDGALYTERYYYGGDGGRLVITIPKSIKADQLRALAATVADLHEGFIAVGGETSIGHGLFSIKSIKINGESQDIEITGANLFKSINAINNVREA